MGMNINSSFVFKTIAIVVATIFLMQQMVWAQDLADTTLNDLTAQQSQNFAPEYLQSQEAIHQEIIDQKQAIEDFGYTQNMTSSPEVSNSEVESLGLQGPKAGDSGNKYDGVLQLLTNGADPQQRDEPVILMITENGDEIRYRKDIIDTVTKKDGTIIKYESGVVSKVLKPDGSTYIFGKVEREPEKVRVNTYIGKEGYVFKFNENFKIDSVTSPAGVVTFYDAHANPVLTWNDNELLLYGDEGKSVYMLAGKIDESVVSSTLLLRKISSDRVSAEKIFEAKGLILKDVGASVVAVSSLYADAQLKLDAAVKTRQSAENISVSTSIGIIKPAGYYTYSEDGIAINKNGAFFKYDAQGRLLMQDASKGLIRYYEYIGNTVIETIAEKALPSFISPSSQPYMWGGRMELNGAPGEEILVKRSSYETLSSAPVYSIDFSVGDKDPEVSFGLRASDGDAVLGKSRVEVVAHSSCLVIKGYRSGAQYLSVPVTDFKINTQYTARFEVTARGVNVYVWEKGACKPANPSCVLDLPQWSPRFFVSTRKGDAVFDAFSVSFKSSLSRPVSAIAKLWSANQSEAIARTNADAIKASYDNALSCEAKVRLDFDMAAENLNLLQAQEIAAASAETNLEHSLGLVKQELNEVVVAGVLQVSDGTVIDGLDTFGNDILSSIDFSYIVYGAGNSIVEIGLFDGSRITFDDKGLPISSGTGTLETDYSYLLDTNGGIKNAVVRRGGSISVYGDDGSVRSVATPDGTKIEYQNGDISAIYTPGGSGRLYTGGKLSNFFDKDGSSFTFDEDGRPLTAKDEDGNSYAYEYSVDPSDAEETVIIRDLSHGVLRFYKNDILMRTEDAAGLVLKNSYSTDGKLVSVTIEKRGVLAARYDYTYITGGIAEVKAMDDAVRIYSPDGRLATMTDKEGYSYNYAYPDANAMHVEFVRPAGWTGTLTDYLPGDFITAQDFINGKLARSYKPDGTATLYSDSGKPFRILDPQGEAFVEYQYNSTDELVSVKMCGARKNLIVACETAKAGVDSERERLICQINQKVQDFDLYYLQKNASRMINADNAARQKYLNDYNVAITPIKNEAALARAQVEEQASQQIARINAEGERLGTEIARQEAVPLITYYYRTVFGRDPDQDETDYWLARISSGQSKLDKAEMVAYILASPEYLVRKAQADTIKSSVRSYLESYFNMHSDRDKELFLTRLGLDSSDTVALTQVEADAILKWIDSQGLHFGQSAFLAIKNILSAEGIQSDIQELSANIILIDILTGAIDASSAGDLQLSMHGLSKYAESKGLKLYDAKLGFDELVPLVNAGKMIAHIDGNHYIVVNKIECNKVYYREENRGPAGTDEVMSKDDFIKKWSGCVIAKTKPQDERKILSVSDAKQVKGAFFFFLLPIIAAIVSAVAAVVSAVAAAIAAVATMAATVISAIGGIMASAGAQLASGVGAVLSGIGASVGSAISAPLIGIAVKTVLGYGLSFGISVGMQVLGLDSTISGLTASFLTGGILGLINPASGAGILGSFLSEGIKYATIAGVNEIGLRLNLDPSIVSILSMASGGMVDGLWHLDIGGAVARIAPTIAGELAYSGVKKLGESLGVDITAGSFLAGALSSLMRIVITPGADLFSGIMRSINSGIASVGVSLVENWNKGTSAILRSTGIVRAVESILDQSGLFNNAFNALCRMVPTVLGVAEGTVSGLFNGARTFLELVAERGPIEAMDAALNSLFSGRTIEAVIDEGGVEAILARGHREAVLADGSPAHEIVISDDTSVYFDERGELIAIKEDGMISTGTFAWTTDDGIRLKNGTLSGSIESGYSIWAGIEDGVAKDIIIFDPDGGEAARIDPGPADNAINIGALLDPAFPEFNYTLINATIYYANSCMARIRQGKVELISQKVEAIAAGSIYNHSNRFLYALANGICSGQSNPRIPPKYIENLREDLRLQSSGGISDGDVVAIPLYQGMTPNSTVNSLYDAVRWISESQSVYGDSLVAKAQADLVAYFASHPGEWNRPVVGVGYSGGFMPLVEATSGLLYNVKTLVGLGAPTAYLPGVIPDALMKAISAVASNSLSAAAAFMSEIGVDRVFTDIDQVKDMVVAKFQELVMKSNLTNPSFPIIPNPKTDMVVNVWGTEDIFHKIGVVDARTNFLGKTTFNIEIVGASHGDYIRRASTGGTSDPSDAWNITVSRFVTDLLIYSKNKDDLYKFIQQQIDKGAMAPVDNRGVYVVKLPGCDI